MIPSSVTRYRRIKECLEDPTTLVYLHFVAYLAGNLTPFMKLFQKDEPLVHMLYDKANEVTRSCLRLFLKPEVVDGKGSSELTAIDCEKSDNWLSSKSLEIGTGTKRVLSEIPTDKQQTTRLANRKSLKVMGGHMKDHMPVNNTILRDLQCLHPVVRKEESG